MIQALRSSTQVRRGSSTPHASSGKFAGSGAKLGLASICQFDTPSVLRHGQMRMAAPVFDAYQQNGFILHLTRTGIEHRMRRIRPILSRQDGIRRMAMEQLGIQTMGFRFSQHADFLAK